MTPPNKAYNLYHKFYNTLLPNVRERQRIAIEHSLIAVDEILDILTFDLGHDPTARKLEEHWQQVKNQLLKQQNNG